MEPEERSLVIRVIELATGITAVTAVLVLSSVVGLNAYFTYQPAALQAQAIDISAQNAPVTANSESTACEEEIAVAAARGSPDTQSTITDSSDLQFEDTCVAAVLDPAVTGLGPTDPGSYMCVGKSAQVNVSAAGTVTETAIPDPVVPAGTCTAVACGPYDGAQSNCIAAKNLTSLSSTNIESDLTAAQQATLSPDLGISTFTLDPDGSITDESVNTANTLDTSAGDQGLANDTASLDQGAAQEPPSIGENEGVAAQSPETSASGVTAEAPAQVQSAAPDVETASQAPSAAPAAATQDVPAASEVTPPEQLSDAGAQVPSQLPSPELNGPQPTTPTIDTGAGEVTGSGATNAGIDTASSADTSSENILEQFAGDVKNGATALYNDVSGFFGVSPIPQNIPATTPANIGIRG